MNLLNSYLKPHSLEIDEKFHQLTQYNVLSSASFAWFLQMIAPEREKERVPGDIVECGIGRSRSLIILSSLLTHFDPKRKLIAFDSFAGFPEPMPQDNSYRNPQKAEWSTSPSKKYKYTQDFSRLVLESAEINLQNIDLTLVEGYFEETLPKNSIEKIALLNLDGDLYSSYKVALENLFHKVSKNGIIIFDDFGKEDEQEAFPGARLAVKEFLGKEEYSKIKLNPYGVYYYIKEIEGKNL